MLAGRVVVVTGAAGIPSSRRRSRSTGISASGLSGSGPVGLYCTKDTYVSTALEAVRDPRWLEKQTGVALSTLKTHYEKWMPDAARDELHQLGRAFGGADIGGSEMWTQNR